MEEQGNYLWEWKEAVLSRCFLILGSCWETSLYESLIHTVLGEAVCRSCTQVRQNNCPNGLQGLMLPTSVLDLDSQNSRRFVKYGVLVLLSSCSLDYGRYIRSANSFTGFMPSNYCNKNILLISMHQRQVTQFTLSIYPALILYQLKLRKW